MERNKENMEALAWTVVEYWQQDNIIDYVVHVLQMEYRESKDRFDEDVEWFIEDLKKDQR